MEPAFPDYAQLTNLPLIEEIYARYQLDPSRVDPSWRYFFEGLQLSDLTREEQSSDAFRIFQLITAYRRYGHLRVPINPIATDPPEAPELEIERLGFSASELDRPFPSGGFCKDPLAPLKEIIEALSQIYSTRIGFEYMDLDNPELELWIQNKIEPRLLIDPSIEEKRLILEALNQSEAFENFLHTRYVGQKRFSLEGIETAIPVLLELIEEGARLGLKECFIGMAHRGRLNVLANILNKPYALLFREFEDTLESLGGRGDVKYHKGFSSERSSRSQTSVAVHLAPNPSHLESVDPIVLGQARARQVQRRDENQERVGAFLFHGDAALAGQGVVYESLQLFRLPDYSIGGTIHVVLNNQIGFTTLPEEGQSTRYCTDIAKTFRAPVFHVSAEDPEACLFAAQLAMQIRSQFHSDVFLDLNGYRKYGHNEGDEPSFTQPRQYKLIRMKKTIREMYREQLLSQGHLEEKLVKTLEEQFKTLLQEAQQTAREPLPTAPLPPTASLFDPVKTTVDGNTLQWIVEKSSQIPNGFHLHPKLKKWLEDRLTMMRADPSHASIDWGLGEHLAYGSLLLEGVHVRLAGQDSRRGTFSHRHMMWIDQETASPYFPLAHLKEGQARFDLVNTPLSEYAAMGFEYGYSWTYSDALVLWEAQFGDFSNGAQIIIDQYIAAAEEKWSRPSSLVLLLPHAFEGQGPEHSSARLERFLQLSANQNMQIVNASTPAQLFHVLRRQALRAFKKPLILFTPKGLLRSPQCTSPLDAFTSGGFEEILDDPTSPREPTRLLLCSGHIYYDLFQERNKRKSPTAIIRIEQLYPFHQSKLKSLLSRYSTADQIIWVQEEPQNMGAWEYIAPLIQELLPDKSTLRYAGRERSASVATGSHRVHEEELNALLNEAFR